VAFFLRSLLFLASVFFLPFLTERSSSLSSRHPPSIDMTSSFHVFTHRYSFSRYTNRAPLFSREVTSPPPKAASFLIPLSLQMRQLPLLHPLSFKEVFAEAPDIFLFPFFSAFLSLVGVRFFPPQPCLISAGPQPTHTLQLLLLSSFPAPFSPCVEQI